MHSQHKIIAQLAATLRAQAARVATVESCTGGALAHLFTDFAGSSAWFERGFVTYSDAAKREMVGVAAELLRAHGAVSVEVAGAMAEGGIRHSHAQYAVAITGIAGPAGGSAEKPVGTVCFGWAGGGATTAVETRQFAGNRQQIRTLSVRHALRGLLLRCESAA